MQQAEFNNGEKGSHKLMVRLTPTQHKRIKFMAESAGMTISNYVRNTLLSPSIEMKLNKILNLLGEESGKDDEGKV